MRGVDGALRGYLLAATVLTTNFTQRSNGKVFMKTFNSAQNEKPHELTQKQFVHT